MTLFKNAKFIFVLSSLFIAILGLVKSLIFAKYLSFESLGFLALFQSTMALVATFHFGILSGGYRLASYYSEESFNELNSVVYSLVLFLFIVFIIIIVFFAISGLIGEISQMIYFGFFAGFVVLLSSWAMNISIAKSNLSMANKAQLCGAFSSLIMLPFVFEHGLYAAYAVVVIQPLVIFIFLTKSLDYTLPNTLRFDISVVAKVFKTGFLPFLAGLFFIIYQQLEKILIGYTIDIETLGHLTLFYLVFTVWSIVPDSLNKIFYPKATLLFETGKYHDFNFLLVKHFGLVIGYCLFSFLGLYFTLVPAVQFVLPQHLDFVNYIYLGIGVYVFKSLCETPSIFLLSSRSNNSIVISDAFCFVFYLFLFCLVFYSGDVSVVSFIIISTLYYFSKFSILIFLSLLRKKELALV